MEVSPFSPSSDIVPQLELQDNNLLQRSRSVVEAADPPSTNSSHADSAILATQVVDDRHTMEQGTPQPALQDDISSSREQPF